MVKKSSRFIFKNCGYDPSLPVSLASVSQFNCLLNGNTISPMHLMALC